MGLILGIVNKNKCGKKTAGILLNIFSMIIVIVILLLFILFSADGELSNDSINNNYVSGVWNCKSFNSGSYIVTMKLNEDSSFVWNKYGDEINNHVYGHYTWIDEKKTNNSGSYKYYMIDLVGEEFVSGGLLQDEPYRSQYDMGINEAAGEAILMNVSTYNMYYCYLEK